MNVGFAGAGNMAAAMARGWAAGDGGPEAMLFSDAGSGRAEALAEELGGEARANLAELGRDSDLVVLAVKPAALEPAAEALGSATTAVLSVLGATPVARLRKVFPDAPLFRAMPNLAVEVRRGLICHTPPEGASDELSREVLALLGLLGRTVELEERLLDPATAVMGCSPAYFALVAEVLADAGAREGLDEELSRELVLEALAGTAQLLETRHPASLRAAVASPGGSTEAGLEALDRGGATKAFEHAVRASMERMRP
jgi:pyrroline-5-carboxylate reductase